MVVKSDYMIDWKMLLSKIETKEQYFQPTKELSSIIYPILYGDLNHPEVSSLLFRPIPTGRISLYLRFGNPLVIVNKQNFKKNSEPLMQFVVGVTKLENLNYIRTLGRVENFVVTFKPGGFTKLFNTPASTIKNKIVKLNTLINSNTIQQFNKIGSIDCIKQRVNKLMQLLTETINKSATEMSYCPNGVINKIEKANGNISIKQICKDSAISTRSLQRYFSNNIGISPKEYIRIIRFNKVLQKLLQSNFANWHEIVFDFGYYDQSHFIHDFKSVTGYSPTDFVLNGHKAKSIYLDRFGILKYDPL